MPELTKDADILICCIYKEYLQRRKENIPKSQALAFDFNFYMSDKKLSKWLENDVKFTLAELSRKGYIKLWLGCSFCLLDNAIIYMENRFKDGIIEVTDFISKFL